ncbi:hypothetical protein PTI98_004005 [Pleurotus ostreatus]|nr:hypothetical protein PTI98_004005 [Pleurotus ostreatus]
MLLSESRSRVLSWTCTAVVLQHDGTATLYWNGRCHIEAPNLGLNVKAAMPSSHHSPEYPEELRLVDYHRVCGMLSFLCRPLPSILLPSVSGVPWSPWKDSEQTYQRVNTR